LEEVEDLVILEAEDEEDSAIVDDSLAPLVNW